MATYPTLDDIAEVKEDNWFILYNPYHGYQGDPNDLKDEHSSLVWVSPAGFVYRLTLENRPELNPPVAWLVEGVFTWTENPFWIGDLFYDQNTHKEYPTGTVIHCHYPPTIPAHSDPSEWMEMDVYLPVTANRIGYSRFNLGGHT